MGTVFQIPWTFLGNRRDPGWPQPGLDLLRRFGFKTAAMALKKEEDQLSRERLGKLREELNP